MHLFEGVTAVIFCASLSDYDQLLFEDETKNRMIDTKELFEWILKLPYFKVFSLTSIPIIYNQIPMMLL